MEHKAAPRLNWTANADAAIRRGDRINRQLAQHIVKAEPGNLTAQPDPQRAGFVMHAHRNHRMVEPRIADARHREQELAGEVAGFLHLYGLIRSGMRVTPPLVSIIVPAFGLAHLVGETIESIITQSISDWEAIIIDDGSPDDVAGAVQPYLADPRIRFLSTDNGGLPTARNRAIAEARAPLLALLDGDDLWERDYLAQMMAAMDADAELGFVTCDATYFGASRDGHRFSLYAPQEAPLTLDRVLRRSFNVYGGSMIRREAIDAVGGFRAELRSAEDFDLWVRILGRKWRGGYVDAPLARYRRRAQSMSRETERLLHAEIDVYTRAEADLAGRPEADTARLMREQASRELAVVQGEAMVLRGQVRAGLKRLRDGEPWRGSLKWSLAMPVLTIPGLARPLLAARERMNRSG